MREYPSPCRLQASLTRSTARMRTHPRFALLAGMGSSVGGANTKRSAERQFFTGISPLANILHLAAYKQA